MIAIWCAAIWARRWRAAALGALAVAITAIAVAGPAYIDAATAAMVRNEMAHATTAEISVAALNSPNLKEGNNHSFETQDVPKLRTPFMDNVFGVNIDTVTNSLTPPGKPSVTAVPYLVFREGYCAHVVVVAGRCAWSTREVMIPWEFAEASGLAAGATVDLSWAKLNPAAGWLPASDPVTMSVVGVYRAKDIADRYWGSQDFFTPVPGDRGVASPFLTARGTIDVIAHDANELRVDDSFLKAGQVTPAQIPAIRSRIAAMTKADPAKPITFTTSVPALLDRIDHDRKTAQIAASVAVAPLVLLGCFVLFLAIAYGLQERRVEVGVVRLRGVRAGGRWWLAIGEAVAPLAAGAAAGVFAGLSAALLAAHLTVPGRPHVSLGDGSRRVLLYVLAAMLVTIVAAHQRTLSARVADLLRRVPARAGWRAATLEIVVVALAVAAVAQLKAQSGDLDGVTLLAPGLVIIAVAVLAGRLAPMAASRLGAAALARGARESGERRRRSSGAKRARLGLGIGALQLARRPGAQRLMTVHVLGIGILTLTIAAGAFQSSAQRRQIRVELGADRVLAIAPAPRHALIDAVDQVDPTGRFAMLAMTVPANVPSDPPLLAVDSARLAAVSAWPDSSLTAMRAHAALTRSALSPPRFSGAGLEMRVDAETILDPAAVFRVQMLVVPLRGAGAAIPIDFGVLRAGDHDYTGSAQACAGGCRIAAIGVTPTAADNTTIAFTIERLRTTTPVAGVVDLRLSDAGRWRPTDAGKGLAPTLTSGPRGLAMSIAGKTGGDLLGADAVNMAGRLPVISTGPLPHDTLGLIAGRPAEVDAVASASSLPRLGSHGAIVDLRVYDAGSGADTDVSVPQVWLNDQAPPDVLTRLKAAGLIVTDEADQDTEMSYAGMRGPAVGMRFDRLAGYAALLLAMLSMIIMAAIDRRSRAAELRVLRVQGLSADAVRRAAFVGHAGMAVAAGVIGGVAALASWLLVSDRLPIFAGGAALIRLDLMPPWTALAGPAVAGAVALAVTAAVAAQDVCAVVRRDEERGSAL